MSTKDGIKPTCRVCGEKVWRVSSGLVCDECDAKIVPEKLYAAQWSYPLICPASRPSRAAKFSGRQPETLFEQNERLAQHGERQRPLFTA